MYSVFNLVPKKLNLFFNVVGLVFFLDSNNEHISGTLLFVGLMRC